MPELVGSDTAGCSMEHAVASETTQAPGEILGLPACPEHWAALPMPLLILVPILGGSRSGELATWAAMAAGQMKTGFIKAAVSNLWLHSEFQRPWKSLTALAEHSFCSSHPHHWRWGMWPPAEHSTAYGKDVSGCDHAWRNNSACLKAQRDL